ncbi:MAG: cbb3-type cytochrome c oxidase subunit I [Actinomycetota bacterium]|nr:cbb3-type cytochrome c oxidase subunit I [Actinomycetota bacterium]
MTTIDPHATSSSPSAAGAGLACVAEWLTTTDHKRLGRLYIGASALAFVGVAAVALLLGIERISPTREWLDVDSLTQLFALERFGFIYLVMVPLVLGVALAIVPLQVGARSLAFPRLAAAGFWAWLLGAVLAVVAIVNNGGPNGEGRFYNLFVLSTVLVLVGLLASAGAVLTTILTTRAPGMNLRRVPFFTWSVLVATLCMVVALPVLVGDLLYLYVAHRYIPADAALNVLSSNRALAEWAGFGFSQPTTVIFAIPVLGFLADAAATAAGTRLRPRGVIFGGIALMGLTAFGAVLQTSVTLRPGFVDAGFGDKLKDLLPFGLVHGLAALGVFVAFVFGAQVLVDSKKLTSAALFGVLAGLLALAGVSSSALSHIGAAHLLGTTFEEGTLLTLVFAAVLAAMGAVSYWGQKWWGSTLPAKSTLPLALLAFAGAELATLPLLIAGFADQPSGVFPAIESTNPGVTDAPVNFIYSGPAELWNLLSTVGIGLVLLAVLVFVALSIRSFIGGEAAGDDPWDGQTLEWATTSPAPLHNFADIHIVKSAEPLLDLKPSTRSEA